MSASDIADALVTNLSAASVYGANQATVGDFSVMETSACCAVIGIFQVDDDESTLGGDTREVEFIMYCKLFRKDTSGNANKLERQMVEMLDKAASSLRSDQALQGDNRIRKLGSVTFTHDPESLMEVGGAAWAFADGRISVTELINW